MSLVLHKELIVLEDLALGFGTSNTSRGSVTLFNAAYLPYDLSTTVAKALDARPTLAYTDVTYAKINGNGTLVFSVADGVTALQAVNKRQLDNKADTSAMALKADKTNVLQLNNSASYAPSTDFNPATKLYVDTSIYNRFSGSVSGSFTSQEGKIVTVTNGLITGIV
jgi:hypothetical protein